MRRLIAAAVLAATAFGSGLAGAAPKSGKANGSAGSASTSTGPGPNGHNDFGLCKAYFAGSATGQAHKRKAGPFAALEAKASDGDDDTSPAEDVAKFCENVTPGGK